MSEPTDNVEQRVRAIAERVAAYSGLEVVEVSWMSSGRGSLQVFVDKEGGVGIDDCVSVSRQMSTILDAEDVVPGAAYQLEVSSPGLDRKLVRPADYERFAGKKIKVKLRAPKEGRHQYTGVLCHPKEDRFSVELDLDEVVELRYDEVRTTRLVIEI
jgi:ribosome maturation factor RimP